MFQELREAVDSAAPVQRVESPLLAQLRQNFQIELENGNIDNTSTDQEVLSAVAANRPAGMPDDEYFEFLDEVFKNLGRENPIQHEYVTLRKSGSMNTLLEATTDLHTQQGRDRLGFAALNHAIDRLRPDDPRYVKGTDLAGKIVTLLKKQGIDWPGGPKNAAFLKLRTTADLKDPTKVDQKDRMRAESGPASWVWQLVPIGKGPNPVGFKVGSGIPAGDFANVQEIAWSATRENGIRMIDVEIPGRGSR